jgi:hypothetical protein
VALVEEVSGEWLIRLARATGKLRIEEARLDGGDVLIPVAKSSFAELVLELAILAAALAEHDAAPA